MDFLIEMRDDSSNNALELNYRLFQVTADTEEDAREIALERGDSLDEQFHTPPLNYILIYKLEEKGVTIKKAYLSLLRARRRRENLKQTLIARIKQDTTALAKLLKE